MIDHFHTPSLCRLRPRALGQPKPFFSITIIAIITPVSSQIHPFNASLMN
jgi:hypothetical protein